MITRPQIYPVNVHGKKIDFPSCVNQSVKIFHGRPKPSKQNHFLRIFSIWRLFLRVKEIPGGKIGPRENEVASSRALKRLCFSRGKLIQNMSLRHSFIAYSSNKYWFFCGCEWELSYSSFRFQDIKYFWRKHHLRLNFTVIHLQNVFEIKMSLNKKMLFHFWQHNTNEEHNRIILYYITSTR